MGCFPNSIPLLLGAAAGPAPQAPGLLWALPFVVMLACIAALPLIPRLSHWWESNRNKLFVSLFLSAPVLAYYALFDPHHGLAGMLQHAIVGDYIPFMVLLFSLYAISGGIRLGGDVPAHPRVNCAFLLGGAALASLVGTTGASMLLIRPLLQVNRERKNVAHTVVFFIFLVSNIGGSLLPVGDPPLFLGYLRGVPFLWTLNLFLPWLLAIALVMAVYCVIEVRAYRRESPEDLARDEAQRYPLHLQGRVNFFLLAGVVLAVALLVPGQALPFTGWTLPNIYLREIVSLALAGMSLYITPRRIHAENHFNFHAIGEVAALFIGIFITMQVPIELLKASGGALGTLSPMQCFWFTGLLSSMLDNAPTYVVFFELAGAQPPHGLETLHGVATASGAIAARDLLAISCGAVFMGANTYIGNGPNFLVKSIAEHRGIKMPGFFGYVAWSGLILLPVFVVLSLVFFR